MRQRELYKQLSFSFERMVSMYTGRKIFNQAIAIIDELSSTGQINDSQVKDYLARAPYLLDLWQKEMAVVEGLQNVEEIESLDQPVMISDRNCPSGAYYLARFFALSDQNTDLARICEQKYQAIKNQNPLTSTDIIDVYGISRIG
jgi:hypothetical protein